MPIVLVLAALQAAASPPAQSKTIVVTARPLASTQRDLDACLARHCPPVEDIEASLAHAENQFVAGDYRGARVTLARSHSRNYRYAKELPVEVADLTRAYGRMSDVDGYSNVGRILQIDALDALKKGLDSEDSRVLMQRLMTGDDFARLGRIEAADDVFQRVERQAKAAHLPRVQGYAMLRQAVVFGAMASVYPQYGPRARGKTARLLATTDPDLAEFRDAAILLKARLAALDGDKAAIDKAAAQLTPKQFKQPVLIYSPAFVLDQKGPGGSFVVRDTGNAAPEWIDVGYRITPAGTVTDIDILRQSDTVSGTWPSHIVKQLATRRYAPMALPDDAPVLDRVERFSMVHDTMMYTGSRIASRSAVARVASLDMTVDPPGAQTGTP